MNTRTTIAKPAVAEVKPSDGVKTTTLPRQYNKIVLTLENCILPEEKLKTTPSREDGLAAETEKDLRILGCELIQTAGILLRLPQVAMATGQVLFQRFYYSKSFVRHSMEPVAMGCISLASKIEEAPRRVRDVINVFHHIKQVRLQKDIAPMLLDQSYVNLKTQVIKAERRVLKELGFCVHVKHPHKLIVMYLQVLRYEHNQKFMQMSWNYMNDSLRTDVFMRYTPESIACACIFLSARKLGIPLPLGKYPWYGVFAVSLEHIIDICYRIMELYTRAKPNVQELEEIVESFRRRHEAARKSKTTVIAAVTTVERTNSSHNAWGGFIQRAVPLPLPESKPKSSAKDSSQHSSSETFHSARTRSRSRSRSRSASVYRKPSKKKYHTKTRERADDDDGRQVQQRSRARERERNYEHDDAKHKKKRHYSHSRSRSVSPAAHKKTRKSHEQHGHDEYEHGRYNYYKQNRRADVSDKHHHHSTSLPYKSGKHSGDSRHHSSSYDARHHGRKHRESDSYYREHRH